MKKLIPIFLLFIFLFIFYACSGGKSQNDVVSSLGKKVDKLNEYKVTAVMEVTDGDKKQVFDLEISYKDPDLYKVKLTNRQSENVQIVLKNEDGVYILTPALNKSFKFDSDWPLNSSQAYLFQSLVKDIAADDEALFISEDGNYIFETKTNYKESRNLTTQKIVIDKETLLPKEVFVYDSENNQKFHVLYNEFDLKPGLTVESFSVDNAMSSALLEFGNDIPTYESRTVMYPTYLPAGYILDDEQTSTVGAKTTTVMTFTGEKTFTVIEEYVDYSEILEVQYVFAEPIMLSSGMGHINDTCVSWISNGISFMVISEELSEAEMIAVANSFMVASEK